MNTDLHMLYCIVAPKWQSAWHPCSTSRGFKSPNGQHWILSACCHAVHAVQLPCCCILPENIWTFGRDEDGSCEAPKRIIVTLHYIPYPNAYILSIPPHTPNELVDHRILVLLVSSLPHPSIHHARKTRHQRKQCHAGLG